MEANVAPTKIYVHEASAPELTEKLPYHIEYTRTDAFIEEACELLARMVWEVTYEDLEGNSVQHYDKMEFIDDFRNYLKGEQ